MQFCFVLVLLATANAFWLGSRVTTPSPGGSFVLQAKGTNEEPTDGVVGPSQPKMAKSKSSKVNRIIDDFVGKRYGAGEAWYGKRKSDLSEDEFQALRADITRKEEEAEREEKERLKAENSDDSDDTDGESDLQEGLAMVASSDGGPGGKKKEHLPDPPPDGCFSWLKPKELNEEEKRERGVSIAGRQVEEDWTGLRMRAQKLRDLCKDEWQEFRDAKTGCTFYYNIIAETSQWKKPHDIVPNVWIENNGIGIMTQPGENVKAIHKGIVKETPVINNEGQMIILEHGDYLTSYFTLATIFVSKGDQVSEGQVIGTISKSRTKPSLLHFEIWKGYEKLNPENWLEKKRNTYGR